MVLPDLTCFTRRCACRVLCFCLSLFQFNALGSELSLPGNPSFAAQNPEILTASIYDSANPQQLLYRFKRVLTRTGSRTSVLREFLYPDGKPAAREHVLYDGNALKSYELEELQTGIVAIAQVEPDTATPSATNITFQYVKRPAGQARSVIAREPLVRDVLITDMVGPFLASHWDQLQRGKGVSCRFIVVQRQETIGFTFRKESESNWNGRQVVILKMQPTSLFISALIDPLYFTVEKSPPHRVLRYAGRTTPMKREGSQWKDLDAITVFDWADVK